MSHISQLHCMRNPHLLQLWKSPYPHLQPMGLHLHLLLLMDLHLHLSMRSPFHLLPHMAPHLHLLMRSLCLLLPVTESPTLNLWRSTRNRSQFTQ